MARLKVTPVRQDKTEQPPLTEEPFGKRVKMQRHKQTELGIRRFTG